MLKTVRLERRLEISLNLDAIPLLTAARKFTMKKVSVLMVIRNEQAHILGCLRSLLRQELKPQEILIIDHGSDDNTLSLIRNFREAHPELNLVLLERKSNHLARSRQELLSLAQNELVAFVDGDCEVPKTWLRGLVENFEKHRTSRAKVIGVGGPNRLPPSTEVHQAINLALDSFLGWSRSPQAWKPDQVQQVDHLPTTNCLFLKSALISVGGFSAPFARYGEDLDLGLKLGRKGFQMLLAPDPVVINHCADNFAGWLGRLYRFGQAQALVYKTRRGSYHPWKVALLLPGVLLAALLLPFSPLLSKLLGLYILLSLVTAILITGIKKSMRLAAPFWLVIHLSPLAYSLGFWMLIVKERLSGPLQHFRTNVLAHLKRGPVHFFRLMVGMVQGFLHR